MFVLWMAPRNIQSADRHNLASEMNSTDAK